MKRFKKIIDGIASASRLLCMGMLAALVVITALELVLRRFLNGSWQGAAELSVIVFLWMVFIGLIPLYHDSGLMRLDFLVGRLKAPSAEAAFYLNKAFSLVLGIAMAAAFAAQALRADAPALSIPVPYMVRYVPMALAGAYIAAAAVYQVLDHVHTRRGTAEG